MALSLHAPDRTDPRLAAAAIGAVFGGVALGLGAAAARDPLVVTGVIAGVALVGVMMLKVEWAALVLVAAEPFEGYLESFSGTAVKFVGGLLFVAWLARLLTRTTPAQVRHPVGYAIAALFVSLLAATSLHANGTSGVAVATRYLSFMAVALVLIDCMRTSLPPRRVAAVWVWSCTAAACVGLVLYLVGADPRASGPITDPNDFGFFLISAVPLALHFWRAGHRYRHLFLPAAGVLLLATLATVSRGAMLGLAAMVGYALLTRQLRMRAVVATVAVLLAGVMAVVVLAPRLVQQSVTDKQHVAARNVEDRFVTWAMAAEMTADHPLLGTGPDGFRANYREYQGARVADPSQLNVAHEMYLQTSAELGLIGLAAFASVLGLGFAGARRRALSTDGPADLGRAVCTAFVGVLVAAAFLTEQYYLPIWLLAALGAALDPVR